jgi:hypothetical protein
VIDTESIAWRRQLLSSPEDAAWNKESNRRILHLGAFYVLNFLVAPTVGFAAEERFGQSDLGHLHVLYEIPRLDNKDDRRQFHLFGRSKTHFFIAETSDPGTSKHAEEFVSLPPQLPDYFERIDSYELVQQCALGMDLANFDEV